MTDNTVTDQGYPVQGQRQAAFAARYAHELCFSSRRGVLEADRHHLIVYDNNPTDDGRRDRVLDELCKWIAANGGVIRGDASYPDDGESAGYTRALVIHGVHRSELIAEWERLLATQG